MDVTHFRNGSVIEQREADTTSVRERQRSRRLRLLFVALAIPLGWVWYRILTDNPIRFGVPRAVRESPEIWISVGLMLFLCLLIGLPLLGAGRSPHTLLRPSDSTVRLADVVGASATKREAIDTLNLFLKHQTFADELGGSPRRGVLFEGPPGTGKTYLAKALAAEAGVPFLFVSASSFQSMYYGQTNRKIRSFFKALRKHARAEGGAIGFIEEFDAIGGARSGMNSGSMREGVVGIVNELLVQMQSFDLPSGRDRMRAKFIDMINSLLPHHLALPRPRTATANILVVAATNRAADLDPALLRPGRFDRVIHFDLPPRADRVEIASYYLDRKVHDSTVGAEQIADLTAGYSPVRIERLLDEALVIAVREGRHGFSYDDVVAAQLVTEVGVSHEVGYQPAERQRVATHEAGHALAAALLGREVRVASILRRGPSLGLVAHDDAEERHLKTPSELRDLIVVAMAGRAAEIQEFGEASTGIAADLAAATTMAAQLVGLIGAGDSLLSLEAAHLPGAGNLVAKVLGDESSRQQADDIVKAAADRAACLLMDHRETLLMVAEVLVERDELSGDDVHRIVDARRVG